MHERNPSPPEAAVWLHVLYCINAYTYLAKQYLVIMILFISYGVFSFIRHIVGRKEITWTQGESFFLCTTTMGQAWCAFKYCMWEEILALLILVVLSTIPEQLESLNPPVLRAIRIVWIFGGNVWLCHYLP